MSKQRPAPGLVVSKYGSDGSRATDGTTTWSAPAYTVRPVDDVIRTGDAFAAGFLIARLGGTGIETALQTGNAAGASLHQITGDVEGLPYRADLPALRDGAADVDR